MNSKKRKIKTSQRTHNRDKKTAENVKDARALAEWSEQAFNLRLWLKQFEKAESPSDDDKHQNKLWAIEHSLDAAKRLFKAHNIPIPQAFSALRLDLYEAIRGRKATYFKSAGNPNTSMPMMVLKAYTVAAVELLRQAGEKDLNACYQRIAKLLKKEGLDLQKVTDRKPSYLVIGDWRKSMSRKGADKFVQSMRDAQISSHGGKNKDAGVLNDSVSRLIEGASKLFPDHLKKV